jgi:hypothetical protein
LRYILKHYTSQQFLDDFVAAELERLEKTTSPEDLQAARRGYLEAMLMLPELLSSRASPSEIEPVREALEGLREAALRRRITIYGSQPDEWYRQELITRQVLEEPGFHSGVPVVGPLIASFREAWNDVSTKWYVRLILQQQVAFNRLAAAMLDDLSSQAGANARDISWLAGELAEMNRHFLETLNQMQNDLDVLREQMRRIEDTLAGNGATNTNSDANIEPGQ